LLALRATGVVKRLQVVDHLSGELRSLPWMLGAMRGLRGRTAGVLVDEYVAVSRFIADRITRAGVPAGRVRLIENGLPLERYSGREARSSAERPTVVFAGWLIREKGAHVLLESARGLEREADWVIAGAGPARTELEALSTRLGVPARFVGHVDSPELLRRADIVVVPSLW